MQVKQEGGEVSTLRVVCLLSDCLLRVCVRPSERKKGLRECASRERKQLWVAR